MAEIRRQIRLTMISPPGSESESAIRYSLRLLKPSHERVGAPPAAGPVSDGGQEGEHGEAAALLLNRGAKRGVRVTRCPVGWRLGRHTHTSADDECRAAGGGAGTLANLK